MPTLWTYSVWRCIPTQTRCHLWWPAINNWLCRWHDYIGRKWFLIRPLCSIRQIPTSYETTWAMSRIWQDPIQEGGNQFMGIHIIIHGHKPAEERKRAIAEVPRPTNVKELRSFPGVCNILSKYSPRLAELSNDLHQLTCKGIPFNWGPEHMEAFNALKEEITSAPVLWYYHPKKPLVLQTDASSKGHGAVLLQENQPVYFTSKALSPCQ